MTRKNKFVENRYLVIFIKKKSKGNVKFKNISAFFYQKEIRQKNLSQKLMNFECLMSLNPGRLSIFISVVRNPKTCLLFSEKIVVVAEICKNQNTN